MSGRAIVVDIEQPRQAEQPALDAALANAGDDDSIHLFHGLYHRQLARHPGGDDLLLEARDLLLEARRGDLAELARQRCGDRGHSEVTWTERGWPALLALARQVEAALVVTTSRRQKRWQRLGDDNEDWALIRYCPAPLLLTRHATAKRYRRVVAAVDPLHDDDKPADLDRQILRCAAHVATRHAAALTALNIASLPAAGATAGMTGAVVGQPLCDDVVAAHAQRVDALIARCRLDDVARQVLPGVPSIEIVDYVRREKADLLVMGAVSRSTLARLLIGNTAERVLDRVDCDVLVVKPEGFDARLPESLHLSGAASAL